MKPPVGCLSGRHPGTTELGVRAASDDSVSAQCLRVEKAHNPQETWARRRLPSRQTGVWNDHPASWELPPKGALRDQPGTAGSDARDLLSFAHGVGAAGEEDAEPVVIEVAEPST